MFLDTFSISLFKKRKPLIYLFRFHQSERQEEHVGLYGLRRPLAVTIGKYVFDQKYDDARISRTGPA